MCAELTQRLSDPSTTPSDTLPAPGVHSDTSNVILQTLGDLETRLQALRQMHEQGVEAQRTLHAYEQALAQREQIVKAQQEALEKRHADIERGAQEIARQQLHLKAALSSVEEQRRQVDEARQESERIERTAKERAAAATQLAERVAEQERRAAEQQGKLAEHEARLAAEKARLDAEQRKLEAEVRRAREEAERFCVDHQTRDESLRQLEGRLNEQETQLREQADALEKERLKLDAQKQDLATQPPATGELGAIWSGRAELMQAQMQEVSAARESLERELAGARKQVEDLNAELETARSQAGAAVPEELQQQIDKRDRAIAVLKERLRKNQEAAGGTGSDTNRGPTTEARHDRLRRYKSLLQGQARKIVQAQHALQKRHSECEQVLAQRSRLSALATELAKVEKRTSGAKARGGAAAVVLCSALTFAVLAVLSWTVAPSIWPQTYAASAVVQADTHGRQATDDEVAAWLRYHQDLTAHPQLMEVVAQRMNQRGITTLGTPGDVNEKVVKNLFTQSSTPGELKIELRGQGAERTAMILDTFVTAMKSVSDTGREQRSQDLGLVIAQAATAGAVPLDDTRIRGAATLLGGSVLAAAVLGLFVWSRLVRSKQKFEQAQAVAAALEEVDWGTLEQSFRRPTNAERAKAVEGKKTKA